MNRNLTNPLLANEPLFVRFLVGLRPGFWSSLRRLCRGSRDALVPELCDVALSMMPLIEPGQNLCAQLQRLADGSSIVLAAGKHRWSGKLGVRRLRVCGAPGAKIHGKVQLAEGSSGSISEVDFISTEGSALRMKGALWNFLNCAMQCSDPDASLLTAISSRVLLRNCTIVGGETRPCWVGLLAKGKSNFSAEGCRVGPNVKRGSVTIEDAQMSLADCELTGCEEIAVRLDGRACLLARETVLRCGGAALHAGSISTGSLKLENCSIDEFEALWGGVYRPLHTEMSTTDVLRIGSDDLDSDVDNADHCDAELAA